MLYHKRYDNALSVRRLGHFPAIVIAASVTDMMRAFDFTAVRALDKIDRLEGIMRSSHVAARP